MSVRAALVAALSGVVVAGVAAPAEAGDTRHWSTVATELTAADRPSMLRHGDSLDVFWTASRPADARLMLRTYTPAGTTAAPVTLLSGWDSLTRDPVPLGGGVALAGRRGSAGDADPWPGNAFRVARNGALTGMLSAAPQAYATQGEDARLIGGVPVYVFTRGGDVLLHRGLLADGDTSVTSGRCCTYQPGLATGATGTAWVAWYYDTRRAGLAVRRISGLPGPLSLRPVRRAPGATSAAGTVPGQRTALARRPNGDVWLAYLAGNPERRRIRVWRLGSAVTRDIRAGRGAGAVSLAADTRGRLWVAWTGRSGRVVRVARSTKKVTRFGTPNTVPAPAAAPRLSGTAIDTTAKRADVIVTGTKSAHHRLFLPALTATGRVVRIAQRLVTVAFRVRDAGVPLAGASLRIKGVRVIKTDNRGRARTTFPESGRRSVSVTADKTGYALARLTIRLGR